VNIEARVEKLEREAGIGADEALYDSSGSVVDAKIVKRATSTNWGRAIMPDGTEREIAPVFTMSDVILHARHTEGREGNRAELQERLENALFVRPEGKATFCEFMMTRRGGK
jgi:hypothetical protein